MQIVDLTQPNHIREPLSVALGYFDTIHVGHQALIERAKAQGYRCAVFTFSGDFYGALGFGVKPIFDWTTRLDFLQQLGVDYVLYLPAEPKWLALDGRRFLELFPTAKHFVCGTDFRFGSGADCDVEYLVRYCNEREIGSSVVELTYHEGRKVSTRYLRTLLQEGDMTTLAVELGRPYSMHGVVTHGKELGRTLGLPTANFVPSPSLELPKRGVYAASVPLDGQEYLAVANVGAQPTVGGDQTVCETHVLGFSGDLYGEDITVRLHEYLRPIVKFEDVEHLKEQVLNDIRQTKEKVRL